MATPRKPTQPTTEAIDWFCSHFDDLFCRRTERQCLREYLIALLLPREHNKTLTVLASLISPSHAVSADRQRLHHFLHDAPWDEQALNRRRLALWQADTVLAPHDQGVLIIDETGDPKRGHGIPFAAQQYLGKLGHTANGVVSVTSQWADGKRHLPLGVKPYRPAKLLPLGKADPTFRTKPELAWELIQEAQAEGISFRLVVADCVYGENSKFEARLFSARIRYILALRPNRGTWQFVEDPSNPPAFTPAEAAARVALSQWQPSARIDSHGKELVRYVAELQLGTAYGPDQEVRLIAATDDPTKLKAESTWYMATNLTTEQASAAQVYQVYSLRDWIEHYYKPAKHELGWADFQMRKEQAIVRHWQLVMLAYTFSLLVGTQTEGTKRVEAGCMGIDAGTDPSAHEGTDSIAGSGKKRRGRQEEDRMERDAEGGEEVVVSMGEDKDLLAELVDTAPTLRVSGVA